MNYYETLKISKNADKEQIKDAYKAMVKKYHPDLYVGDKEFAEKKLKEINEAYKILSDSEMKLEYDKYLESKLQEQTVSKTVSNVTQNSSNTTYQKPTWTLSDFIVKKINKLDSNQQLRIFVFVIVTILILLLINLIEIKQYFDLAEQNIVSYNTVTNNSTQNYEQPESNTSTIYENSNLNDIDNMIYDFWQKYEEEFYNGINNI